MALKTRPIYISQDDFYTLTGIDLREELSEGQSPDLFLLDCENQIINYVNLQSWRPISKDIKDNKLSDEQMDALRQAIIEQARYVFYNGNILINNGIDPEQGVRINVDDMQRAAISPMAIDDLKMAGLLSLTMRGRW